MAKNLVAIVLPMYNEEVSIPSLRSMFDRNLSLPPDFEHCIIAVNDGSNDGTLGLIGRWSQENKRVTILSHTKNMGLGQAILTGFGESIRMGSTCVVTMDADASHPGTVIKQLVDALLAGADIAIASRFAGGGRQKGVTLFRRLLSFGARVLISAVFPLKGVTDYTVGFRVFRTSLVEAALSKREGTFLAFKTFTATAELLLKMATMAQKIVEVPLVLRYDLKKSRSKLKLLATVRDYVSLCRMPREKCSLGKGLRI